MANKKKTNKMICVCKCHNGANNDAKQTIHCGFCLNGKFFKEKE